MAITVDKIKELRARRKKLTVDAGALFEDGMIPDEKREQWEGLHAEADQLKTRIEEAERQLDAEFHLSEAEAEARAGAPVGGSALPDGSDDAERAKELESRAFTGYIRWGFKGLKPDEREIIEGRRANLSDEQRAQAVGTDTAGGFTVPEDSSLMGTVNEALLQFGGMRRSRSTVLATGDGRDLPMPTANDTTNTGVRITENTAATAQDVTFGQKVLRAYTYSSYLVPVSNLLLQDTGFAIEPFLGRVLGTRIGRITNTEFTNYGGASGPEGLLSATTLGKTAAGTTSFTYSEYLDLKHSVDPAYRLNAEIMFQDGVLKFFKQMTDGEGRLLWQSGIAVREPDTIDGDRYVVNQDMPAMTTGQKVIAYGDFSNFYIRDVRGGTLLRLAERYAEYNQTAFLLFTRHDSALLDAGTNPIKHMILA